ncbi:DEAD/DEAH box helicase [Paenibacillus antri]|uniref:DEAD/DEAH box helicase n=1 Tax=Paenibacillus antri TaxID=2582848 RepID=A0A5R9G4V7_9BACL|nr:DEAD/DEAH box helicase [Paenibacillus antri]
MAQPFTLQSIKRLCGRFAYEDGEAIYAAGRVRLDRDDPDAAGFGAEVAGIGGVRRVSVSFGPDGSPIADCDCEPFLRYEEPCEHIAAALLQIYELRSDLRSPYRPMPSAEQRAADGLLALFASGPPPDGVRRTALGARKETLDVEWIVKAREYADGNRLFAVEMKLGPGKTYVVPRIRDFLDAYDRGEAYAFTARFAYEPQAHRFAPADEAALRELVRAKRSEEAYRAAGAAGLPAARRSDADRSLPVPPYAWEALEPLLAAAPSVALEAGSERWSGLRTSEEPLPLKFEFDAIDADEAAAFGEGGDDAFRLDAGGLDGVLVMETYGLALHDGKLVKLPAASCRRLAELQRLLTSLREPRIRIPADRMETFLREVVPGLLSLGEVRVAKAVSDRIVQTPLKARIYLDRVRDRLLAGVEFQYGDLVVNPLEARAGTAKSGRILLRDGEKERRILELMDAGGFVQTESGYFLTDEADEFEFLYEIVPKLERLADIFATTAVKVRIVPGPKAPVVKVDVDERVDWLEIKFDLAGIPESDIRQLVRAIDEKKKYYRLPSGALMPLEREQFQQLARFLKETGLTPAELSGATARIPVSRGLYFMDLAEHENRAVKLGKSFRQVLENMRYPDNLDFPVPPSLDAVLREYQKHGFRWMKLLAHYRFGGVLADDMGLGKTLQSIAFLVSVLPDIRERREPAIVVAPASLTYNWRNELQKFAPDVKAVLVDGDQEERAKKLRLARDADVVITSYPLLRRDIASYARRRFHTVILDEAQAFKNYATQTAHAVKRLQASHRFALTGTPIENGIEELWSIFDVVFPTLFPERRLFRDMSRSSVAKRVRPFLLRRLKSDVLGELPEKIETVHATELFPEQKRLYAAYLAKLRQETLKHLDVDNFHKSRMRILAGLTRLRQICCHPALFVEGYEGGSGKFESLLDLLEEGRGAGKRMLVFSQFTGMLELIGRELGRQGVPYFYLDGDTPAAERVELCDRFNDGERSLFLISLKAGGTGLNLTGADTVILYDLWWNPAVEQQAADRAHRIGQTNVVQVIRLVAGDTLEEKIYELQQRKKHLIDDVVQAGPAAFGSLSEAELRELLSI